ncbi:hypothetical protein HID58_072497 [Brassica napus]|uniref:Uncharacterized protein n=1 Tax=Brassica napus TaxID=3708 RepID=A0ABQ7Z4L1_BRANA|nr:hypothetical protein HID58_072497 [Brassica napus]
MRALEESKISIVLLLLCFSIFATFSLQANEVTSPSSKEGEVRMVPLIEEKFMVQKEFACLYLVALQLTAISQINPLVIAPSLPNPAIALVAIAEIFPFGAERKNKPTS